MGVRLELGGERLVEEGVDLGGQPLRFFTQIEIDRAGADIGQRHRLARVKPAARFLEHDGQLDGAQRGARVAADARHRLQDVLADLVRDRLQMFRAEAAQVRRGVDTL